MQKQSKQSSVDFLTGLKNNRTITKELFCETRKKGLKMFEASFTILLHFYSKTFKTKSKMIFEGFQKKTRPFFDKDFFLNEDDFPQGQTQSNFHAKRFSFVRGQKNSSRNNFEAGKNDHASFFRNTLKPP